jgi:uncharacterized membrane protein
MDLTSTISESLIPILRQSIPVAAIAGIVALAALSFKIKRTATDRKDDASDFDEKENFRRSEFASKIGMISTILLLFPYTISVAGLFNQIANSLIIIFGIVYLLSTLISVLLL